MAKNTEVTFDKFLENKNIAFGLSAYLSPNEVERYIADVRTVFELDAKIRRAIQSEEGQTAAYAAIKSAASMGLSLNPALKQCYLSTYKNARKTESAGYEIYDVTAVPQKAGYIVMATKTGQISFLTSGLVYKNDIVEYKKTASGDIWNLTEDLDDRGELRGAYAMMTLSSGRDSVYYMSVKAIEKHREDWHSRKYNGKYTDTAWWDPKTFPAMGEKTCLKYLCEKNNIPVIEEIRQPDYYIQESAPMSPAEEIAADIKNEQSAEQAGSDMF